MTAQSRSRAMNGDRPAASSRPRDPGYLAFPGDLAAWRYLAEGGPEPGEGGVGGAHGVPPCGLGQLDGGERGVGDGGDGDSGRGADAAGEPLGDGGDQVGA